MKTAGVLTNGSIVGDPLFQVPIYQANDSLGDISLCFEIHGQSNEVFNLISDTCISVNALYRPMHNPDDGNIIHSIGIRAVDNGGQCVNVTIDIDNQCLPLVESEEFSGITNYYEVDGIVISKHNTRVRVLVPNCENVQLVMWVECQLEQAQEMILFSVTRGLNLHPTSHGLLGERSI